AVGPEPGGRLDHVVAPGTAGGGHPPVARLQRELEAGGHQRMVLDHEDADAHGTAVIPPAARSAGAAPPGRPGRSTRAIGTTGPATSGAARGMVTTNVAPPPARGTCR